MRSAKPLLLAAMVSAYPNVSDEQMLEIFRSVRSSEILDRLPPGPDVYTGPRADIEFGVSPNVDIPAIRAVLERFQIPEQDLLAIAANPEPSPNTGSWHLVRRGGLYENMAARARELANTYPALVGLETLPRSSVSVVEGAAIPRPILALTLSTPTNRTPGIGAGPTRSVYIQCGIHGDEVTNPEYCLRFVEWGASGYGRDPEATRLLDAARFVVVPAMNPDGLANHNRVNAHRVDLNRNMDGDHFGGPGSGDAPGDWNYRGPFARSEPESQAIEALVKRERPAIFLDVHQYSSQVLYPWAWTTSDAADSTTIGIATALADAANYTTIQTSFYGLASGDITDWAYGELSRELGYTMPAFCIEMGDDLNTPYKERNDRFLRDFLPLVKQAGWIVAGR
jgi:hypothetical protein